MKRKEDKNKKMFLFKSKNILIFIKKFQKNQIFAKLKPAIPREVLHKRLF